MTIKSSQYLVDGTAVKLVADNEFPEEVHIHIAQGNLYLGGSDVSDTNGYKLDANSRVVISNHENGIYGISPSGTTTVYVMVLSR